MAKDIIRTEAAPAPVGPYSQAVQVGPFLYCSGQIALVPGSDKLRLGSIQEETRQVMENVKAVLGAAGHSLDEVVKTTIFLSNMDDFAAMNEIYAEYFTNEPPARSCVAVKTLPKNVNVEVETIAYRG